MRNPDLVWGKVCDYFNEQPLEQDIPLTNFLNHFNSSRNSSDFNTLDNYRRILSSSGYIRLTGIGIYQKVKDIPIDLAVKDASDVKGGSEKKYQLWYRMIQYHRGLEIGITLTSKDYLEKFNPTKCTGQARIIDVYKNKLKLAGVIESAGWGKYKVVSIPDIDLKVTECKK